MVVFKFGGASINSIERIRNTGNIIRQQFETDSQQPLLLVVSAIGKTTNALETVASSFFAGDQPTALQRFDAIRQNHLATARNLLSAGLQACQEHLADVFTEAEWLLHDRPVRGFDYYYDQIVCIGELLSTILLHHYLLEQQLPSVWLDIRDLIRTDDNFRDANVDWDFTRQKVSGYPWTTRPPKIVITQGFIGATADNESTTLGREGSDYTAAILAHSLDATSVTIWKDVASVMNADPKRFTQVQPLPELSYEEVIEMAFYGAQVIHPKTMQPLHQKRIPLYVKCFLDPALPGTVISDKPAKQLPPILVSKENQALLQFSSKDFSFSGETAIAQLYHLFEELSIRPQLTQNGAISFWCSIDDKGDKTEQLALAAAALFHVKVEKGLTLLTIRHYEPLLVEQQTAGREKLIYQQTRDTVQVLMR